MTDDKYIRERHGDLIDAVEEAAAVVQLADVRSRDTSRISSGDLRAAALPVVLETILHRNRGRRSSEIGGGQR